MNPDQTAPMGAIDQGLSVGFFQLTHLGLSIGRRQTVMTKKSQHIMQTLIMISTVCLHLMFY